MVRFMAAFFLLITLCFPVPVGAVGKSTVDPNAARVKAAEHTISDADAGTSRRVSYEAGRKTVVSILADLSAMTGVTIKAGYNNDDWQVRDRRMNIFVKDTPLSSLMNSIARVMKLQWIKHETDGVVSYRLYMDRKALLNAQRQRQAKMEQARQHCIEGRQRLLSGLEAACKMSEDELEELKTRSPYTYMQANGWARCLPRVFAEVPTAKDAWLRGEGFAVDAKSLSSDAKQGLLAAFGVKDASEGSIVISSGIDNIRDTYLSIGMAAVSVEDRVGAEERSQSVIGPLSDPESESANISARSYYNESKSKSERDQYLKDADKAAESEEIDMGEPLKKHKEDPALCVKVQMKVEGDRFADVLATLAESSGFMVVSDSFDARLLSISFPSPDTEARAVLDKLEHGYRYNWEKHGSTLELHSRDWFRKRDTLVPEARLEAWRKAFKERGTLDIDELAQIAMLTPEQILANVPDDDVLGHVGLEWTVSGNRDLLSLYAGLNAQQKAMVFTEQGLGERQGLKLDSITNTNDGLNIDTGLSMRRRTLQVASKDGLRLVGIREKHGKQTTYTFSVVTLSGGTNGIQRKIECPVYIPPAKEKPKDEKSQPAGQKSLKQ